MVEVRTSLTERIINALGGEPQKRGEHFSAFHRRWADLLRPIVGNVEADRDRLAAQLAEVLEYAGHKVVCDNWMGRCTCGWTAMRERHAKGKG